MKLSKKEYKERIADLNQRIKLCLNKKEKIISSIKSNQSTKKTLEKHLFPEVSLKKEIKEIDSYVSDCLRLRGEYEQAVKPTLTIPVIASLVVVICLLFIVVPVFTGLVTLESSEQHTETINANGKTWECAGDENDLYAVCTSDKGTTAYRGELR